MVATGVKGVLRKEMNSFAMEQLAKRWDKRARKPVRPRDICPYQPKSTGIFMPSPKGGLPHERHHIKAFMNSARDARPHFEAALIGAFVALKGLAET